MNPPPDILSADAGPKLVDETSPSVPSSLKGDSVDDFEAIDIFAAQRDLHSLLREVERIHPRLVKGLSLDPSNPKQFENDLGLLRSRFDEPKDFNLDEAGFYALLGLSELPGLDRVANVVRDIAYRQESHSGNRAALEALQRWGEEAARVVLQGPQLGKL